MSGPRRKRKSDWPTAREWYYGMPRPVRRLVWWWLLPFGAIAAEIAFMIVWPSANARLQSSHPWLSAMWIPLVQLPTILVVAFISRRVHRAFVASGGRLCTNCAHSLAGLADVGVCPECGAPFDIERDRKVWKDANIVLPPQKLGTGSGGKSA